MLAIEKNTIVRIVVLQECALFATSNKNTYFQ